MMKIYVSVFIVFISLNIYAHKALLLVEDNEDGTIYIEAGISTGGNATGNMIYITEIGSGKPLWQGAVPDSGNFDLVIPKTPYLVTLDMGKGHKISKRGPFKMKNKKEEKVNSGKLANTKVLDFSVGKKVAVDLVPIEKLLKELTVNTEIDIINILNNISIEEVESYIKENESNLKSVASSIDGFVNIRSIWQDENVFNYLRRYNIRIAEIDLASPLDPQISGVAVEYIDEVPNHNIWLNFTNITKMAEIVTKDLSILFPSDSAVIMYNLKIFKKEIFKLKVKYENLFINVEDVDVAVIGHVFDYILNETIVSIGTRFPKSVSNWDDVEYQKLVDLGKKSDKKVLVVQWVPNDQQLQEIIKTHKFNVVILNDGLNSQDERSILEILDENYLMLYQALIK